MKLTYYPGCTLKTYASSLDLSARASMSALGIELEELPEWTCCGANFSLSTDNIMKLAAPIRNLSRAERVGEELVTICSACYNVLKRADYAVKQDPVKLEKLNLFLFDENNDDSYNGKVKINHLLEAIKEHIGFEELKKRVKKPLTGIKIAPYYGCLLLKPNKELNLDDPEAPEILHEFIDALGGESIDYPLDTECCGSYLAINQTKEVWRQAYRILRSASAAGADVLVTSCPLCLYNLDKHQTEIMRDHNDFKPVPILYFTQLLGLALGLKEEDLGLVGTHIDPKPVLKASGLL